MDKFEFIVRNEMRNETERQLYRMFGRNISDYDFTLDRIVDLAIESILEHNDFEDEEYESGIEWSVDLAIQNILELEDIVN